MLFSIADGIIEVTLSNTPDIGSGLYNSDGSIRITIVGYE